MRIILAPSKTMNFVPVSPKIAALATTPQFYEQAQQIVTAVRAVNDLGQLMRVSQAIADRTKQSYDEWPQTLNLSAYAYVGDVYKGFFASTLTIDDLKWAQTHLLISSGLYGLLRPLDTIAAYRLEMKAKLSVEGSKDLYDFWGDRLARFVDQQAEGLIYILSSDEYAKTITKYSQSRLVTPVFLDKKPNGQIGTVPIYSKMMRGVMARWMIDHRVETPEELQAFSMYGYEYDAANSTSDRPAFYRPVMTPLRFMETSK
jgi:cytoplasmic iron level regulating protein YaaA (DUF328/UPF0246 family)